MEMETVSDNRNPTRYRWRLPSTRTTTLGIAVAFFIGLSVLPVVYMFAVSLTSENGDFSFENYRLIFTETRQRYLLLNSTLLGAATALVATLLGAPLGLLLARVPLPGKSFWRIVLAIPLVIPPYILALAWVLLSGPTGLLVQLVGRDLLSSWTYSLIGTIVVLALAFYPLSMLTTEAAARRVDGRLEEAGLLVAHPRGVLFRITLPLIAPAIGASAVFIFVLAVSEFGVPGLLRVRVFTTEVFTAFAARYDFGSGVAIATPLLAVALIAGVVIKVITGEQLLATRRSAQPGLIWRIQRRRVALLIGLGVAVLIFVLLPLFALGVETQGLSRIIAAARTSSAAITNSLLLAIVGASLILLLSLPLGYNRARARVRFRGLFDLAFIVIFAVPSTVVGIGIIGLWNRPGFWGEVYASQGIIAVAYMARFVPVLALIIAASVRQIPASLEEAAEVSGASWLRTFVRIILPQMRVGLLAAWVVAFIFAFGELGATILVAPPGESTLPVRVYTLIANAPPSEVAALALMQVGIIVIPLAALGLIARDRTQRARS
jgi:iron(III) transport system permease protein